VVICLSSLPEDTGGHTFNVLLLGIAPGGGCRAIAVTSYAGRLLPYRFTLATFSAVSVSLPTPFIADKGSGLLSVALPQGYPCLPFGSSLPYGVRTFLRKLKVSCDHIRKLWR